MIIMTPWLGPEALNAATGSMLAKSSYDRVFIHPELGVEPALYEWSAAQGWSKSVQVTPREQLGPNLWDVIRDLRWLSDPNGASEAEIARVQREFADQEKEL